MPKPPLREPYRSLEPDIRDTMLAGLKSWRSDLCAPESYSDWSACIRALLDDVRGQAAALAVA